MAAAHRLKDRTEAACAYARGDLFAKRRALMEEWAQVATGGVQDEAAVAVGQD